MEDRTERARCASAGERTTTEDMVMRRTLFCQPAAAGLLAVLVATHPAMAQDTSDPLMNSVKIRIDVEGAAIMATLEDSRTVRDFVSLLPLTIMLEDYASTEKVSDLPRKLDTEDAPAGIDPSIGDITYYAPWGNLAIFYKDFGYARGLVRLGTIDSGIEALDRSGRIRATIELVEK
jgi:hypothetical protein